MMTIPRFLKPVPFCTVLLLISGLSWADKSDHTLHRWLSRSDLVVIGTVANNPVAVVSAKGVLNYHWAFKVADVCKGNADLRGESISVSTTRIEIDEKDLHPLIKKDAESILFLKNEGTEEKPNWVTADYWFGIQRPSPWMVKSIKRLVRQKE
jgi:hypothetical protein